MTVDTNNLRYLLRRSSRNYDLQFDNDVDRLKENDVICLKSTCCPKALTVLIIVTVSPCSDDCLVRVKAQVMTRDDSTGGWVPMGGGGMSRVGLHKLASGDGDQINEYLIHGQRIADQSVSSS